MYLNEPIDFLILVFVGLMAGAINTLGGGGSLITLPALIFLGLPPSIANASNRIGILFSSISATTGYASKGVMNFPFNIYLGFSALFGSLLGAKIAIEIDGELFNKILSILMIIVLLLIVFKPSNTQNNFVEKLHGKHLLISILIFFLIGIYGVFINAGIGIIIMFFLNSFNNLSLVKSNATKVSVVSIYTFAAVLFFAYNNKIDWEAGFVLATGTSVGAWLASRWSVLKGDKTIKIFLIICVSVMSIKLWFF